MEVKNPYVLGLQSDLSNTELLEVFVNRESNQLMFDVFKFKIDNDVVNAVYIVTVDDINYWLGFKDYDKLYIISSKVHSTECMSIREVDMEDDRLKYYLTSIMTVFMKYHLNDTIPDRVKDDSDVTVTMVYPVIVREDGEIEVMNVED